MAPCEGHRHLYPSMRDGTGAHTWVQVLAHKCQRWHTIQYKCSCPGTRDIASAFAKMQEMAQALMPWCKRWQRDSASTHAWMSGCKRWHKSSCLGKEMVQALVLCTRYDIGRSKGITRESCQIIGLPQTQGLVPLVWEILDLSLCGGSTHTQTQEMVQALIPLCLGARNGKSVLTQVQEKV